MFSLVRSFGRALPRRVWARVLQRVALVSILTATLSGASALAQTELRLGTAAPRASAWGLWVQTVADEVEKASDGALRIRVIADGALGGEKTLLRQGMKGRLDMIMISNIYLPLIEQEMELVSSPFLFDTVAQGSCVADDHLNDMLADRIKAARLVPLRWLEVGNVIVFSKGPITAPSDLQGKKLRISETAMDALFSRKLGAIGVPLGIAETILSLQTGHVDAAFLPTVFGIGIGVHKIAPYLTVTNHTRMMGMIALSRSAYDDLTPQEREWLKNAISSSSPLSDAILASEDRMLDQLTDQGVVVRRLSQDEKTAWRAAAQGIQSELANALGPAAVELLNRIEAAKAACRG